MWPNRRLIDLLGMEHPIVQSPMAGFSTVELAAAVCDAGALGSIGCGPVSPEIAARTIRQLRGLTSKPINVNFFSHALADATSGQQQVWRDRLSPYYRELGGDPQASSPPTVLPAFGDDMCSVVEQFRPEVVSFHFGLPGPRLLTRVKSAGCRVMSSATTVEEALWLEARGVDVIIAQGHEAGGHRATFLGPDLNRAMASQSGTMALVPQVVDAVRVPVIAAGGIADGRGIAAALMLGAAGTQLGTAYLLCPEAATPPLHRDALRRGAANATVLTNVFTGRPRARPGQPVHSRSRADGECRAGISNSSRSFGTFTDFSRATRQRRLHAAVGGPGLAARTGDAGKSTDNPFGDGNNAAVQAALGDHGGTGSLSRVLVRTFFGALGTLPMRRLLCPIAADRHAAPPSHMASGSIDEQKRAGRPFAGFHVGKVFRADEVGQRSCQWNQQRLR